MEWRLFPEGTTPEWTTADWYQTVERAPHLEQDLHRARLEVAATLCLDTTGRTLVDLGAGDGGLLSLVTNAFDDCWGYDLIPANIDGALERGVIVELLDVVAGEPRWADVAVCTEMLEHLVDPHGFLARVREHCDWLVCSSPHTETHDFHYGHHAWAWDVDGYSALLDGAGWEPVTHRTVDMFQVVLAR